MFDRCTLLLLLLTWFLKNVRPTLSSSPDDIQSLPACAQGTCATNILSCYAGAQGTFAECVNSTQSQMYSCARQKCTCNDFTAVENWVYEYGMNYLISTLWASEVSSCSASASKSIVVGPPVSTGPSQTTSTSTVTSFVSSQTRNQITFSQPSTTLIAVSTVFVSINVTPSSEQGSSISRSNTELSSSTPPPSNVDDALGLSTGAKIGIGIGAGIGGGLMAFVIVYAVVKFRRKKKYADVGAVPAGVADPPQDLSRKSGQQDSSGSRLDQAELPASEVVRPRSSIFSELEGSPVQNSAKRQRPTGQSSPDITE